MDRYRETPEDQRPRGRRLRHSPVLVPPVAATRPGDQKIGFVDACKMRGSRALRICPNVADDRVAFGAPKLGWFSALNASPRACSVNRSTNRNSRVTATSTSK